MCQTVQAVTVHILLFAGIAEDKRCLLFCTKRRHSEQRTQTSWQQSFCATVTLCILCKGESEKNKLSFSIVMWSGVMATPDLVVNMGENARLS